MSPLAPRKLIRPGALAASALSLLALAACDQASNTNGQPNAFAANPAPYTGGQSQPGASGWPGAQPNMQPNAMPNMMPNMASQAPVQTPPAPGFQPPGAMASGSMNLNAAPRGMARLPSQVGYVFRANLGQAGAPVPQTARSYYNSLTPFFDQQPQVLGFMDAPDGSMSQVGFQATKNGAPVMGMMVVNYSPAGVVATLMLDSPDRFPQSAPYMMQAAAQ